MNEQTSQPQESLSAPSLSADEAGVASESGNLISGGNQISSKSRGLLIALLFILALGLGGWLVWRWWPAGVVPPPSDVPPPVVVEDTNIEPPASAAIIYDSETGVDTSNWQTYRNEEYGFEFRYPDEWKIIACAQGDSKYCSLILEFPFVIEFPSELKGQIGTGKVSVSVRDTTSSYSRESENDRIQEIVEANYITPPGTFGVETDYHRESDRYSLASFVNQNKVSVFYSKYVGKYGDTDATYYFDTNKEKTVSFIGSSIDVNFIELNKTLSKIVGSVGLLNE
ncbi:MAG: hypothetical protein HYT47_02900 [Candidatus Vogelbacteria bacterium]|nr:hypothetical protein [Candidatus Vogelbacteria bacterium]